MVLTGGFMEAIAMPAKFRFHATVNGKAVQFDADPNKSLLDFLRNDLHLTGAKNGCDVGICGTCSVMVNGALKKACIVPLEKALGADILTVEGIGTPESL